MATATASQPRFTEQEARALHQRAHAAGRAAGEAAVPTPMVWGRPSTPFGTDVAEVKGIHMEGPCGFAWVHLPKATSSFARRMIAAGLARKAYGGGANIWVRGHEQSMERKEAHAQAYAAVLREAGITCYVESRMD